MMDVTTVERQSQFYDTPYEWMNAANDGNVLLTECSDDVVLDMDSVTCAFALLEYARSARPVLASDVQYWLRLFHGNGFESDIPQLADRSTNQQSAISLSMSRHGEDSSHSDCTGSESLLMIPMSWQQWLADCVRLDHCYDANRYDRSLDFNIPYNRDSKYGSDPIGNEGNSSALQITDCEEGFHVGAGFGVVGHGYHGSASRTFDSLPTEVERCTSFDAEFEMLPYSERLVPQQIRAHNNSLQSRGSHISLGSLRSRVRTSSRGTRGVTGSRGGAGSRGGSRGRGLGSRGGVGSRGSCGGRGSRARKPTYWNDYTLSVFSNPDDQLNKKKVKSEDKLGGHQDNDIPVDLSDSCVYSCSPCQKTFGKRHYLLRHVRRMHSSGRLSKDGWRNAGLEAGGNEFENDWEDSLASSSSSSVLEDANTSKNCNDFGNVSAIPAIRGHELDATAYDIQKVNAIEDGFKVDVDVFESNNISPRMTTGGIKRKGEERSGTIPVNNQLSIQCDEYNDCTPCAYNNIDKLCTEYGRSSFMASNGYSSCEGSGTDNHSCLEIDRTRHCTTLVGGKLLTTAVATSDVYDRFVEPSRSNEQDDNDNNNSKITATTDINYCYHYPSNKTDLQRTECRSFLGIAIADSCDRPMSICQENTQIEFNASRSWADAEDDDVIEDVDTNNDASNDFSTATGYKTETGATCLVYDTVKSSANDFAWCSSHDINDTDAGVEECTLDHVMHDATSSANEFVVVAATTESDG